MSEFDKLLVSTEHETGLYLSVGFVEDSGDIVTFSPPSKYIKCSLSDLEKGNFFKRVQKYVWKEFEKLYHD